MDLVLKVVQEALGYTVEIEYAIDLEKGKDNLPSFYLLQIKPLVCIEQDYNVDLKKIRKKDILLTSSGSLGNFK